MSSKKHPILLVLLIIGVVALFLGIVMTFILTFFGSSTTISFGHKIGVISIEGTIVDAEPILSQLIKFKKDSRVKAIILRIDSPGGRVGPSQEIYREVRRTIEDKKVIASIGNMAASGGYYVAAASNKIVANPGAITGSIGVIMEFIQLKEVLDKIGINLEVLTSGEFKDIGSPHRAMTDRDREILKGLIGDIQGQFVHAVAQGRDLPVEKVIEIADGRIFTGAKAKELGLVDALGNFQDAVELAKKMAGIDGDATLLYPKKKRMNIWDLVFENVVEALYRITMTKRIPLIEYRWDGLHALHP